MLPGSESLLYPSAPEGYSIIYPGEHDSLPVMMRLYSNMFTLAAQLGFLAVQLRRDRQTLPFSDLNQRSQDICDIRQPMGQLWESPDIAFLHQHQNNLPRRSWEVLQQVRCSNSIHAFPNTNPITVGRIIPCLHVALLQQYVAGPTSRVRFHVGPRNRPPCGSDLAHCRENYVYPARRPALFGVSTIPSRRHVICQ